jgi:hypothetical protein
MSCSLRAALVSYLAEFLVDAALTCSRVRANLPDPRDFIAKPTDRASARRQAPWHVDGTRQRETPTADDQR